MMASLFKLDIVTPDKQFFDEEIEMLIVRTTEGDIGVLHDHEPLVAPVSIGAIRIKKDGNFRSAACAGGFINVDETGVTIVTDSAEWSDEIDINRAQKAKERAESRLQEENKEIDVLRAKVSLNRAVNRVRVVDKHMNHDNL